MEFLQKQLYEYEQHAVFVDQRPLVPPPLPDHSQPKGRWRKPKNKKLKNKKLVTQIAPQCLNLLCTKHTTLLNKNLRAQLKAEFDIMTHLSQLILTCLKQNECSRRDFIRNMGYQNLDRGHQKLAKWLHGVSVPRGDQVDRIARGLEIRPEQVREAIEEDIKAQEDQRLVERAQDSNYYLNIRMMPAVYPRFTLSGELSEEEALRQASARVKSLKKRGCLNTPRGVNYWFNSEGEVTQVTGGPSPTMYIGNKPIVIEVT